MKADNTRAYVKNLPDFFDPEVFHKLENDCYKAGCSGTVIDYSEFPAADVAPVKHGEWTTDDGLSVCSECGYIPPYDNAIDDIFYSNYCPNCGAKMDGGDNS